jgi:hypothetical protein
MKIEVANGEIVDKYTILKIKNDKVKDNSKLKNIQAEMCYLESIIQNISIIPERIDELININSKIWNIEDDIRKKEKNKEYDLEFIELARSVYFNNDKRAEIKKKINIETDSMFVEEKSYEEYDE